MENIYVGGFPREWFSERVPLDQYFNNYIKTLDQLGRGNKCFSLSQIFNAVTHPGISVTNKDMAQLCQMTNINQLKQISPNMKDSKKLKMKASKICKKKLQLKKITKSVKKVIRDNKFQLNVQSEENRPETISTSRDMVTVDEEKEVSTEFEECERKSSEKLEDFFYETKGSENLTTYADENQISVTENNTEECENTQILLHNQIVLKTYLNKKKINSYNKIPTLGINGELTENIEKRRKKDLHEWRDYIVTFRVHEPFTHHDEKTNENFMQEIHVLNFQSLQTLRDKIICPSDFQDVQGDLSNYPDSSTTQMSRDLYKSAMFYIDNNFYIDKRYHRNVDYSETIKSWAFEKGIFLGKTADMDKVTVGELTVRFGYPYLYMHQGCCEHVIVIKDARLLNSKDSLESRNYPLLSHLPKHVKHNCVVCNNKVARWIVVQSKRLLYDVTYMCEVCFKRFNYKDNKKIDSFKAYRYFPRNMLL